MVRPPGAPPAAPLIPLALALALLLPTLAAGLAPAAAAAGTTRIVDPSDPGAHATIGAALAAALPGDTVVVRPGTYAEAPRIAKALTVCSAPAGASSCAPVPGLVAIQAPPPVGVRIEAADVTFQGFTVQVRAPADGSEVHGIVASAGTLARVRILDNAVPAPAAEGAAPLPGGHGIEARLRGGSIERNEVGGWRNGIYLAPFGNGTLVAGNALFGNGEAVLVYHPGVRLEGNRIQGSAVRAVGVGLIDAADTLTRDLVLRENDLSGNARTIGFRTSGPGTPPPVVVDARHNRWPGTTRAAIEAGFEDTGTGSTVDFRCYRDLDGSEVCPPSAAFAASPQPVSWNRPVQFTDQSAPGGRALRSWAWDFGDDATSAQRSPVHAYARPGTYLVALVVADAEGFTGRAERLVQVVNRAPAFAAAPGTVSGSEGTALRLALGATDADGDPVVHAAEGLPPGAVLDPATGAFAWTPGYDQAGSWPVRLMASDGLAGAELHVTFDVAGTDRPPVLEPVGNRAINILRTPTLAFPLRGSDPDGDPVTYGAAPGTLPPGATLDPATGAFAWTPGPDQVGRWTVGFLATAQGRTARQDATLEVTADPHPGVRVRPASSLALASPGQALRLVFHLENAGLAADTFAASPAAPPGWAVQASPPSVTLAPGASAAVEVLAVPDASVPSGAVSLRATSPSGADASAATAVRLPVYLGLALAQRYGGSEPVSGAVAARWLDGRPAAGVDVVLQERTRALGDLGGVREAALRTGPDGRAAFALPVEAWGANFPGEHRVTVRGLAPWAAKAAPVEGTYRAG